MNYLEESKCAQVSRVDQNFTVEENIDNKIQMLLKEIERLEQSKETLNPLLSMRIRDIREAMSF